MRIQIKSPIAAAILLLSLTAIPFAGHAKSIVDQMPREIEPINAPFEMPQFERPTFPDSDFSIADFGAIEGGKTLNTEAIKQAIGAANQAGGGRVIVPAGVWLTGAIHLKSNVNLHLTENAELRFSDQFKDYLPGVFSRHEGMDCIKPSSFIYAIDCDNIAITGKGRMHGQGKAWWNREETGERRLLMEHNGKMMTGNSKPLQAMCAEGVPVSERLFEGSRGLFLRPVFVHPIRCTNVFIEGVTFLYGPFWTISPTYCENVVVRGVTIVTEGEYGHTPNGDGVNPSSCKNVLIEYCDMDTGDDCYTIKSGRATDGLRVGIPCENVVIRNCQSRQGNGGVVIGSETSGGIYNIFIRDCEFNGTDRGMRFKTARGRGASIENVWVQNVKMGRIVKEAIIVNTLRYTERYPEHPVTDRTPYYRNINFRDISCEYSEQAVIRIVGLPEKPMAGLRFENIRVKGKGGLQIQDARDIHFKNIDLIPDDGPVIQLDQCFDVSVDGVKYPDDSTTILKLIGKKTENIGMLNVDRKAFAKKIEYEGGAKKNAVSY